MNSIHRASLATPRLWSSAPWRAHILVSVLLLAAPAIASSDSARFDIAAQSLATALKTFASQGHMQLLYRFEDVRNINANAVVGDYDKHVALEMLLEGTGLEVVSSGEHAVTIRPRKDSQLPADASSSPGSISGTQNSRNSQALEEVIVSARKRDERLLDVPIAVSSFSGDGIVNRGAANLVDFLQEAPGVGIYQSSPGLTAISIRGVSTSLGSNANGYYLDDLPFTGVTVPVQPDVRTWDLERVEVLRGPQGTLFGEGSMGGTVRILTRNAQFNEWEAQGWTMASASHGGGDNSGVKALVNIPLMTDRLALRVSGTKEKFGGWIDDPVNNRSDINDSSIETYRARLRFQPQEQLSLNVIYWHQEAEYAADSIATDAGTAPQGLRLGTALDSDLLGVSSTYDFGQQSLVYSFSRNVFSRPRSGVYLGGTLESDSEIAVRAHELRLASDSEDRLQWTLGAYYRDASRTDRIHLDIFGIDLSDTTSARSQALFGEATYAFRGMPIDITAGLRWFRDDVGDSGAAVNAATAPLSDATFRSLNPRLIASWRPNEAVRVYASAAKGYRSGMRQPQDAMQIAQAFGITLPPAISPDSIWTYELGMKASLMNGRLAIEGAVYHSDWSDVPVRAPLGLTGINGLVNSKGTKTTGVEASLMIRPTDHWTFGLTASSADARYAGDVPGTGIRDGLPVDDVAKNTASTSIEYGRDFAGGTSGAARIGFQYNSARDVPSIGPPQFLQGDAISTLNARVGLRMQHWSIFAFADNITNEGGAVGARSARPVGAGVYEESAPRLRPRTFGLELRATLTHF